MTEPRPAHNGVYPVEYEAFSRYVDGRPLRLSSLLILVSKIPLGLIDGLLRYFPGPLGMKLRYYWYKLFLKKLGKNVIIDVGVFINGPANVSIGDYCWIDANCILNAYLGEISIGRRVHIAPFSIIGARDPVTIEDYVGISANVKIYANSESPIDGKRMSGPMIPESMKAFTSAPVTLRIDSFVGANSVVLPGVEIGAGAVVGANAVISRSVEPWAIVVGTGRKVGIRQPVTVPAI